MFKTITLVDIDPQYLPPNDPTAATKFLRIERQAKHPQFEAIEDAKLTPLQITEKYNRTFTFEKQAEVDRVYNILTLLSQIAVPIAMVHTMNNAILCITENQTRIYDDLHRGQIGYLKEIISWVYQI